MWKTTLKDAQRVRPTKSTHTTRNHTYIPSPRTQKHNPLRSSQWISSQNYRRQGVMTQYSQSQTTTAPKRHYSSPVTKPSQVKESRNYTSSTSTPTMGYPNE